LFVCYYNHSENLNNPWIQGQSWSLGIAINKHTLVYFLQEIAVSTSCCQWTHNDLLSYGNSTMTKIADTHASPFLCDTLLENWHQAIRGALLCCWWQTSLQLYAWSLSYMCSDVFMRM
jgi:hypothetical protein